MCSLWTVCVTQLSMWRSLMKNRTMSIESGESAELRGTCVFRAATRCSWDLLLLFHKLAIVTEIHFSLPCLLIFQDGFGNLPCGKRKRKGNYTPKQRWTDIIYWGSVPSCYLTFLSCVEKLRFGPYLIEGEYKQIPEFFFML